MSLELVNTEETIAAFSGFVDTVNNHETVNELISSIAQSTIAKFDFSICHVYLVDDQNQYLTKTTTTVNHPHIFREILTPIKIKSEACIISRVGKSKKPEIINDTLQTEKPEVNKECSWSEIAVPIISEGKLLGVINSHNSHKIFYTKKHLEILKIIAKITALKLNQIKKNKTNIVEDDLCFEEIFEKSGDAISIIENEVFIKCNQAALDLFNFKTETKLLNCHPSKLSPEFQLDGKRSDEKSEEMMSIALEKGSHRFEWLHKKDSGDFFSVEVILTRIKQYTGKIIFHSVCRDISIRKQSENKIIQSEKRFRNLFENSLEITCIVNESGFIKFITPAVNKLLGYGVVELVGKNVFNYLHPDSQDEAKERFKIRHEEGGVGKYRIFKVKTKSGKYRHLRMITSNLLNDPSISGFVINAHDVSDIITAEKEKYIAIIDTKENERNRISSDLHDGLGQTIAAANMHMQFLDSMLINKLDKETYSIFKTCSSLVTEATKDTRTISHNFMPRSLKKYGIKNAIKDFFKNYQKIREEINFELRSNITNERFEDRLELTIYRMIQELVSNAVKHANASNIKIIFNLNKTELFLEVYDNGVGFDINQVKKNKNSGIGLAGLNQRVDAFDGKLTINSCKENGTSIKILLKT